MKREIGYYWAKLSDQRGWEVMLYNEHSEFLRCGIPTPWFEDELIEVGDFVTRTTQPLPAAPESSSQVEQEPVRPDCFMYVDDDDTWRETPEDCDIIESAFGGEPPKVGDEFECQVGWTGKQTFRVVKVADDSSDDVEVELVATSRTLFTAPPLPADTRKVLEMALGALLDCGVSMSTDDTRAEDAIASLRKALGEQG